jgi:outer membrane protein TolC
MQRRWQTVKWLAAVLGLWAAASAGAWGGVFHQEPPELQQLVAEMLQANASLSSMAAEVAALREEVSVAGSLPDPMLGIGLANLPTDTFDFDQEPMTQKQVFVSQKIPWFGKLDLKARKTALAALRQEALLEARRRELARMAALTFYDLGFAERGWQVNAELEQMVTQMLQVAEAGYAAGRSPQQDVFQAQVELGRLLDEKIALTQRRRTLQDQLHEMLNREGFAAIAGPGPPALPELDLDPERIQRRLLRANPLLQGRALEIERAQVDVELARKDYYPDMDFRLGYGQRDEDRMGNDLADFVSATVTVNLPVWQRTRQDRQLAAALNRHTAAVQAFENLRTGLPHRAAALVTEIRALQENHRLFEEALLLQADQWSRASLAAYEVGRIPFDTMINAHVRRLRFGLQADQYRFGIYKKLAELEELAGGALPEAPDEAPGGIAAARLEGAPRKGVP